jgi:hypothetical protein
VRFLRHLAAVVLVVAVIVGLGMLWAHASGGGSGIGGVVRRAPPPRVLQRMREIRAGAIRGQSGAGLQLSNTGNLIRTCVIEAVLAAVVITVSAVRLRQRRMRRTAAVRAQSARRQPGAGTVGRHPRRSATYAASGEPRG